MTHVIVPGVAGYQGLMPSHVPTINELKVRADYVAVVTLPCRGSIQAFTPPLIHASTASTRSPVWCR